MKQIPRKISSGVKKSTAIIKTDGVTGFGKRSARYVYYKKFPEKKKVHYKDILFINGCTLPHPTRYRVNHQMEQLYASGLSVDSVFYDQLQLDRLKYYRGFVFFRCPVTDGVKEFIKLAKASNKTCFFDVDDLVIDQKYTDQIEYVKNMSGSDKVLYNDGVNRMRETLTLCDYGITTTECLKKELDSYISDVFINRNVASDEMIYHSNIALEESEKDHSKVIIGYFSGSITHNSDFEMILPAIVKLLNKYKNLYIKIVGTLDIPAELEPFTNRIIVLDFMDWRTMQKEVALCDINLAPLTESIFNEAKSENKWIEASLVKVVTAASNIGAFKKVVKDEETGVLVDDDQWFEKLDELITNVDKRALLSANAQKDVLENHITVNTGTPLAEFIKSKLKRNIAFVLPSTDISGGVNVVLKHIEILRNNGYDASVISLDNNKEKKQRKLDEFNVLTAKRIIFDGHFDNMVATLWLTLKFVKKYPNVTDRSYFVQNFEPGFYQYGGVGRLEANSTYNENIPINYITMSKWCQKWLKETYHKDAKYASNGLELANYKNHERVLNGKNKIRILIEGDCRDHYKNVDESFEVVDKLDPEKFEIVYLSYRSHPKKKYRVDEFHNRVKPEKVGEVYASCDILIKSSTLESFSYPPLEMMATGGFVVVVPNGGNVEYLENNKNCIFYKQGDIEDAALAINKINNSKEIRRTLYINGLATAKNYGWKSREKDILALYK